MNIESGHSCTTRSQAEFAQKIRIKSSLSRAVYAQEWQSTTWTLHPYDSADNQFFRNSLEYGNIAVAIPESPSKLNVRQRSLTKKWNHPEHIEPRTTSGEIMTRFLRKIRAESCENTSRNPEKSESGNIY